MFLQGITAFYLPGPTNGHHKTKNGALISILQRIDKRLVGIGDMLSYDGRLTLIKSMIVAIPNYAMCSL
jgi:hypothetical protein